MCLFDFVSFVMFCFAFVLFCLVMNSYWIAITQYVKACGSDLFRNPKKKKKYSLSFLWFLILRPGRYFIHFKLMIFIEVQIINKWFPWQIKPTMNWVAFQSIILLKLFVKIELKFELCKKLFSEYLSDVVAFNYWQTASNLKNVFAVASNSNSNNEERMFKVAAKLYQHYCQTIWKYKKILWLLKSGRHWTSSESAFRDSYLIKVNY